MSLEIESFDNMLFSQFTKQACVELRDSSSIGVETGQYSYFQLLLGFLILGLDILLVESGKNVVCDVKSGVSCKNRSSA